MRFCLPGFVFLYKNLVKKYGLIDINRQKTAVLPAGLGQKFSFYLTIGHGAGIGNSYFLKNVLKLAGHGVSTPGKQDISRFVSWLLRGGSGMIAAKGGVLMNQQKTGEFLKHLRKGKGLTQEQLAEQFYVSSRTVSRWETGSNMPDVDMLIELADFYDVDIREIIDGERKSENMDIETKDTMKKVAEYAVEEKNLQRKPLYRATGGIAIFLMIVVLLFARETKGLLNGVVSNDVCGVIMLLCMIAAVATLVFQLMLGKGAFDKYLGRKKN